MERALRGRGREGSRTNYPDGPIFDNYSPKAKEILLNIYQDEVEVNVRIYLLSPRGIIVLV